MGKSQDTDIRYWAELIVEKCLPQDASHVAELAHRFAEEADVNALSNFALLNGRFDLLLVGIDKRRAWLEVELTKEIIKLMEEKTSEQNLRAE